jgi:hypothetical protein
MPREISNSDDVIDSRDVIKRIEELEEEIGYTNSDNAGMSGHDTSELASELEALKALEAEAEPYVSDWRYGEALIRDSYFKAYACELVSDIGDLPRDLPSYLVIDWDATAENIRADYTSVDFAGVTYWVRS